MSPPKRSLAPLMLITSFIHLAGSAPAISIRVNHQDTKSNPIFNTSNYSSISEWFSAQGRILEIANNATKECLSRFSVNEDNSVCYGDDKWEWNAVAVICVLAILASVSVVVWLCCDWAQTIIVLFLTDVEDGDLFNAEKTSPSEREGGIGQAQLEEPDSRGDSADSQDTDKSFEAKMKAPEGRVGSVHSRTAGEKLMALPISANQEATSATTRFQWPDSTPEVFHPAACRQCPQITPVTSFGSLLDEVERHPKWFQR